MIRALAYAVLTLFAVSLGAAAQETDNAEDTGGLLVRLLEDNLSGDNRNIKVTGLAGALSGRATIEKLTISDDEGVWLTIADAVLDWNRLALVRGRFSVNELSAGEIIVARAPNPPKTAPLPSPEAEPFAVPELPVSVEIGKLATGRLELGEDLVGREAVLRLDGSLTLAEGNMDAKLIAERLDRPADALRLEAGFSNETRVIDLDLDFREDSGGLIATLLNVPGAPPMQLTAQGTGPVRDFRANIALDSNGERRLAGTVILRGEAVPESTETETTGDDTAEEGGPAEEPVAIVFTAQLGGDIRPLLQEEFHEFFGVSTTLDLKGRRAPEGALEIGRFELASGALDLTGALRLSAEGVPEQAELAGRITPPAGEHVVLPVPGGATTVGQVTLNGAIDGVEQAWRVTFTATDLDHPQAQLGRVDLRADGTISGNGDTKIDGQLRAALRAISLTDPGLDQAIGDVVTLETGFSTPGDSTFEIAGLRLWAPGMEATADGSLDGLDTGYRMEGSATVTAEDLSRFSTLAGQTLGGSIDARLAGNGAPLWGQFDLRLDAVANDLQSGIARADALIGGRSTLIVDATRGESGLTLRHVGLDTDALDVTLDGVVRSNGSDLSVEAVLDDLARLLPEAPGRLTASGDLAETDGVFTGTVQVTGPSSSRADLSGRFERDTGAVSLAYEATVNRIERFVSELRGTVTSSGTAERSGAIWTVDSQVEGPAGTRADVAGTWDETSNSADLDVAGAVELGAVNRLISPMSVSGTANFDLDLVGPPALSSLSGTVTTGGASLAVPQIGNALEGLDATVTLAGEQAQLSLRGNLRSGGGLQVGGPIALTPPFNGSLSIGLDRIVLTDGISYETTADGQLTFAGPLAGNANLSGRIVFGETNINIAATGGAPGAAPIPDNMQHVGEPAAVRATRARAGLIETGKSGPPVNIGLDLEILAPDRVFVRGRGLQAELGGALLVRGSTTNVVPSGSIDLIRGTLELFGNRLDLSKGNITLQGQLVPFIEFAATTNTSSGQSTLEIIGPLSKPEVNVYASPARPPEEALAMLVFGNEFSQLSPLKLAQMAAGFARLAGTGGDTSESIRKGLGVDTLDLNADEDGNAEVGVGTYVAEDLYTDVTVNAKGETELNLNFDINDNLTVRGTVDNEGDTGVGLFFQRDY